MLYKILASSAVPQRLGATNAVIPFSAQQQASSAVPVSYPFLSRLEEQNSYKKDMFLASVTMVICSLDLLLEVFKKCCEPGCNNNTAVKHHLAGPSVVISWTCPSGHKGRFESSRDVNDMKSNNLQKERKERKKKEMATVFYLCTRVISTNSLHAID